MDPRPAEPHNAQRTQDKQHRGGWNPELQHALSPLSLFRFTTRFRCNLAGGRNGLT